MNRISTKEDLRYKMLKDSITRGIESDLLNNNPDKLLDEYVNYFKKKNLETKTIKKGSLFFRGRIGRKEIEWTIGEVDKQLIVPYYGKDIMVAPPLYTSGGRFNRAGISYLYLSTDLETCFAEVHLQVGQECSVGKFETIDDINLLDLSKFEDDLELSLWSEIITAPIHDEIKYKYLVTQFLAEVLKRTQEDIDGLYFKSVQSTGYNIVSFKPEKFNLIKYSEKLYVANKIKYTYQEAHPMDNFTTWFFNYDNLINSRSEENRVIKQKEKEYLEEWIEYIKNKEIEKS